MTHFRKKAKVKKPPRLTFEQKQTDVRFLRATIKNLRKAVRKLSKRVKELEPPTFPRSSQNQTLSSGVEGAHEGTTADESVALAESSLSSPPPTKEDLSAPTSPAPLSTQPDTDTEKI